MQLISVSLHDLQSRMAASQTGWIQYPDESFTQDNATRYYGLRRRSSQTGSQAIRCQCHTSHMVAQGPTDRVFSKAAYTQLRCVATWRGYERRMNAGLSVFSLQLGRNVESDAYTQRTIFFSLCVALDHQ